MQYLNQTPLLVNAIVHFNSAFIFLIYYTCAENTLEIGNYYFIDDIFELYGIYWRFRKYLQRCTVIPV